MTMGQQMGMVQFPQPTMPGFGGGNDAIIAQQKRMVQRLTQINNQFSKKVPPMERMFKKLGLDVSIKGLLKQSQIFTGTLGAIFQILGAFIDITLAPMIPLIVPAIRKMVKAIPAFAKTGKMIHDSIVWINNKMTGWFGGWWKKMKWWLVAIVGLLTFIAFKSGLFGKGARLLGGGLRGGARGIGRKMQTGKWGKEAVSKSSGLPKVDPLLQARSSAQMLDSSKQSAGFLRKLSSPRFWRGVKLGGIMGGLGLSGLSTMAFSGGKPTSVDGPKTVDWKWPKLPEWKWPKIPMPDWIKKLFRITDVEVPKIVIPKKTPDDLPTRTVPKAKTAAELAEAAAEAARLKKLADAAKAREAARLANMFDLEDVTGFRSSAGGEWSGGSRTGGVSVFDDLWEVNDMITAHTQGNLLSAKELERLKVPKPLVGEGPLLPGQTRVPDISTAGSPSQRGWTSEIDRANAKAYQLELPLDDAATQKNRMMAVFDNRGISPSDVGASPAGSPSQRGWTAANTVEAPKGGGFLGDMAKFAGTVGSGAMDVIGWTPNAGDMTKAFKGMKTALKLGGKFMQWGDVIFDTYGNVQDTRQMIKQIEEATGEKMSLGDKLKLAQLDLETLGKDILLAGATTGAAVAGVLGVPVTLGTSIPAAIAAFIALQATDDALQIKQAFTKQAMAADISMGMGTGPGGLNPEGRRFIADLNVYGQTFADLLLLMEAIPGVDTGIPTALRTNVPRHERYGAYEDNGEPSFVPGNKVATENNTSATNDLKISVNHLAEVMDSIFVPGNKVATSPEYQDLWVQQYVGGDR